MIAGLQTNKSTEGISFRISGRCRLSSCPATGQKQQNMTDDYKRQHKAHEQIDTNQVYPTKDGKKKETTEPQRQWQRRNELCHWNSAEAGGRNGLLSGLCHMLHLHTICVYVCNCEHAFVRACADVDLCTCACANICMCEIIIKKTQDRRTPGVCVHAQRQMWLYMIKCLLKRDRASVGIKSGGWREETEWETVWQKQANSVKRKRAQERLTDRRVRIIDRGSDRESMWWWDNRQTDSQGREAEGEEQGRQGETVLFCSKLQNGASEALCLALQRCFITKLDRRNSQTDFNLQSNHLFTIAIHCYWLLIYWLEAKAVKE